MSIIQIYFLMHQENKFKIFIAIVIEFYIHCTCMKVICCHAMFFGPDSETSSTTSRYNEQQLSTASGYFETSEC